MAIESSTTEVENRSVPGGTAFNQWFSPARFALIVGVLIFAEFPWLVLGRETLIMRDFGFFGYPLAFYHRERFWQGEVPLWNPLSDCGIPFLAQWNTLICYPPSLFYLLLPLPWSLNVFLLLHGFLGAVGVYRLAHEWTGDRFAAGVAGIGFVFNGLAINCLIWPNVTAALAWMPWIILAVQKATTRGGRSIVAAAVLGALQMLTGAVELILLTWFLVVFLYLAERRNPRISRLNSAARIGWVVVLITGLSAVQLLPFFDLLAHSNRDVWYFNAASSLPLYGWTNFLIPLFRTSRSPVGIYYQPEQFWATSYYFSVITLALAAFAVWRSRHRLVRWLAAAAVFLVVLALGDNAFLYRWLRTLLPIINLINFPVKYLLLLPFLVSMMAAFGIRELRRENEVGANQRGLFRVLTVFVAMIAGLLVYGWLSGGSHESSSVVWWNGVTRILFLLVGFALVSLCRSDGVAPGRFRLAAGLGVLFLIWLDVATHAPRQNPSVSNLAFQPGLRQLTNAVSPLSQGIGRLLLSREARLQSDRVTLADPLNDYLGHRLSQALNCNLLDGIAKVDGFYPLFIKEHIDVLRILYSQTNAWSSPLADFLSVSHVSTPGNPQEFSPRGSFAPLVTAGQAPRFADKPTTLRNLGSSGFDPGRTVYLPVDAQGVVGVTNPCEAKIVASRLEAQHVEIEIDAARSCLLVLAQTCYPSWRATVDGRPARIWRANQAFQAIEVPAGRSRIALKYEDSAFLFGLAASGLTLCIGWFTWRRAGKSSSHFRNGLPRT